MGKDAPEDFLGAGDGGEVEDVPLLQVGEKDVGSLCEKEVDTSRGLFPRGEQKKCLPVLRKKSEGEREGKKGSEG